MFINHSYDKHNNSIKYLKNTYQIYTVVPKKKCDLVCVCVVHLWGMVSDLCRCALACEQCFISRSSYRQSSLHQPLRQTTITCPAEHQKQEYKVMPQQSRANKTRGLERITVKNQSWSKAMRKNSCKWTCMTYASCAYLKEFKKSVMLTILWKKEQNMVGHRKALSAELLPLLLHSSLQF